MVLYIEALKSNCVGYRQLAILVNGFIGSDPGLAAAIADGVAVADQNLVVLEGLLAAGITELEVPKEPHRRGPEGSSLDKGEGPN